MTPLVAAIYATERGFRVFPIEPGKKKPAFEGWQEIATTDVDQIRRWFKPGRYNVGIATGPMADGRWVVVVDFDCKDGKHSLGSLTNMEALRLLPPTLRVRTPSGGVHLFYLVLTDCGLTLSADRIPGFPGVDVRCDTALVVAAGSTFEGKAYEWKNDLPMAEAPEGLVALLLSGQGQKRKVASRDRLAEDDTPEGIDRARWFLEHDAESAIQGSGGNNATFRVIARVRDFAISQALATKIIEELWNSDEERVSPPWLPEDLDQIIGNAYEFASYPAGIGLASAEFDEVTEGDPPKAKRAKIRPTPFVWRPPETIPPRQFLYGRHLSRGFISATVAHPGVGKTTLATTDALALVSGRNLLGSAPAGKLRVWYWNGEDPREEMERRFHAAMILHGLGPDDIGDRLFLNSGRDDPLVIARQSRDGFFIAVPEVENMVAVLIEQRIDVFILDPFISSHQVSENDNNAIDGVTKTLATIAHRAACAGDLVHHLRKTNGAEATVEDARGASALVGTVRSARVLNGMSREEGKKLGVESHFDFVRASNGNSSMARRKPAERETWFKMESVPLGNGDEVGAMSAWVPDDPMEALQPSDLLAVQDAVATGDWRKDSQAKTNWVGIAIANALRLDAEDEKDRARIKGLLKGWLVDGSLIEHLGQDAKRNTRAFVRVGQEAVA